eukprot:TRINITY_DN502_c0_g1_i2.p2 TRINITY_DN502_c0_g1~~TRINITY_DN502_c0_g1_i2.p2  ORF type:complete len:120 (-),score=41.71 TRINITY_DN502_c0_g1_i2:230-589(-)
MSLICKIGKILFSQQLQNDQIENEQQQRRDDRDRGLDLKEINFLPVAKFDCSLYDYPLVLKKSPSTSPFNFDLSGDMFLPPSSLFASFFNPEFLRFKFLELMNQFQLWLGGNSKKIKLG